MPCARVSIIHPPVSIARDFIDYPYCADLGAVQLAAVKRFACLSNVQVSLVDAYALPGSDLTWREDGRAHLGASNTETQSRIPESDFIVVAYTPFQRPPAHADDVLRRVACWRPRSLPYGACRTGRLLPVQRANTTSKHRVRRYWPATPKRPHG